MLWWRRQTNEFATSRLKRQMEEPAMSRNAVPCDQSTVQGNDFELIPTVKMEIQHSVHGPTSRDFSSIYIVRELWGLKSEVVEAFSRKVAFLDKNDPLWENFKSSFQKDLSRHRSMYCVQIL